MFLADIYKKQNEIHKLRKDCDKLLKTMQKLENENAEKDKQFRP